MGIYRDILFDLTSIQESSNKITYSNSFNDVKNIVNSLTDKELHEICTGTFKNSPYVVYRQVIKVNNDPAAFIDVYSIPQEMEKDEAVIIIACKKKYRGEGYTDILVENAIIALKDNNQIKKLYWEASPKNIFSLKMAERNGFNNPYQIDDDTIQYMMDLNESYIEERVDETLNIDPEIIKFNKELNSWKYGVLINGKVYTKSDKIDWSKYKTIPTELMAKYHVGVCWDFVNYEYKWFKEKGIKTEAFMFVMQLSDDVDDIVTHTFLLFNEKGSKYWFESSWFGHQHIVKVSGYKDVIKELVDRYGNHSYSVYKYSPEGLDKNLTNGEFFKRTTKNLVFNYEAKNESYIEEAMLFNEKDIYYNKDKFDKGDINLCFIIGHSGSGKSTMSRNMSKDNIEHYELDDLQCIKDNFTMEQLKEYGDLIYSYFNGPGKKFYITYKELVDNKIPGSEYEDKLFPEFVHYAMKYATSHKNRKFVIEGVWLFCNDEKNQPYFTPEEFKDYAFYIKGTSMIISKHRAAVRDSKDAKNRLEQIKSYAKDFFTKNWKWYFLDEKAINRFRNYFKSQSTNESYIEEINRSNIENCTKYLEKGDTCYNLDKWIPYENNILFITGISGSGKTTLAEDLAKKIGCSRVELDYIAVYYLEKCKERNSYNKFYSLLQKDCPDAVEFFDLNPIEKIGIRKTWKDTEDILKKFCDWFINKVYGNGQLYIINGAYLCNLYDYSYFYDKPLILKDISYFKTVFRRTYRELTDDSSLLNKIISSYKALKTGLSKDYRTANMKFKNYRDDLNKNVILKEANYTKYKSNFKKKSVNFKYKAYNINSNEAKPFIQSNSYTKKYLNYLSENTGEILVDTDNNNLIGYIFVGKSKDKGFISTLEVLKRYRGYGFGNILLKDGINKFHAIDLVVFKDNEVAIDMYKKFGFIIIGEAKNGKAWWMKLKSKLSKNDKVKNESYIEEATNTKTLYHGSHHDIKGEYILPKNNSYEDDNYVFGTSDRDFALCYSGNVWYDALIRQGYYNGQLYLVEMKEGMFKKVFDTDGYIYEIEKTSDFFQRGMRVEFLSKNKAKIVNKEYIPNVWKAIQKANIKIYKYPNKPNWLKDHSVNEAKDWSKDTLYRVTYYNNEGIYEAFKQNATYKDWNKFLNSKAAKWLKHPPIDYKPGYISYFTTSGYNKFRMYTLPTILKAIDKKDINIEQYKSQEVLNMYNIVYQDEDQIVVDTNRSIHESPDYSELDKSFKVKKGYTFKMLDVDSREASKYFNNKFANGRFGEIAICNETDEVAGFVYVTKTNKIGPLEVYKKYRGYRLSEKLLEDAIKKYGGNSIGVYSDNAIAYRLYKKFGFKKVREKKYKDGDVAIIMELK